MSRIESSYDIIVVGAGHAGVEAALAGARLGQKTLLITNNLDRVAYMSCNPSIGGLGKGHMVREIDAMGGIMGLAADKTCLQFKRLNSKKGPAVRGSRTQNDKDLYSAFVSHKVQNTENLVVAKGEVESLVLKSGQCHGVVTKNQETLLAKSVVIATGTFMKAVMHFGLKQISGGRVGDEATFGISDQLAEAGFKVTRLKTGTPPRLDKNTIDWSKTQAQGGDKKFYPFSYKSERVLELPQIECFLTYTNEQTHDIIRNNLNKSPMFTGVIEGIGPRYCPSIEDKITRFADREQHQSFLEVEGLNTDSVYLQGISTSLPEEVQQEFLETIPGLEKVKMLKPGYAVEYDFIEPTQIKHSLETRLIKNLFLAGQINGTSGYEEAAGQGLVAGTNAAFKNLEKEEFILGRHEAYVGVLIDDLVTKGTKEPYRMMTSRAEHRLVLREDNVLERLAHRAFAGSLLSEADFNTANEILLKREKMHADLEKTKLVPNAETQAKLQKIPTQVLNKPILLKDLLRRSEVSSLDLGAFGIELDHDDRVYEPVEISVKYQGYIDRQNEIINQSRRLEELALPESIDFKSIRGLSGEEVEKLTSIKPRTIGQMGRISGVNPSAIQATLVYLKGRGKMNQLSSQS